MKRIILFLTVCLGLSVSQTTFADNAEMARAATKRSSGTNNTQISQTTSNRSVSQSQRKNESTKTKNTRTASSVTQRSATRTPTSTQNVKQRSAAPAQATKNNVVKRVSTTARNATKTRIVEPRQNKATTSARSATVKNASRMTRAAELNNDKITTIKSKDYSKCKSVYFECMDEFCANKDTNLRRCACSNRATEFDNIKKQLNDAEDQMTKFNQRLLTVNLDKEDAAAINIATEGELALDTSDKSESEKLLQKITKTLNSSGDSKITNDLSAISLSLDMDTAWDDIDAFSGIATSAKTGTALYNAAQPICLEMAQEVCDQDELSIVQDGYKLTIEQDCNTVSKSYNTLYNQAMEKVHESGALLDIARLNVHQQRNSDDTLTCRKKILEQLSDSSVCGTNLYKCLDITGQYINPSTGAAFLSPDLYKLGSLLQAPTDDKKWTNFDQNEKFVSFINSKKTFLEPAIANCKDIADTIWSDFLEDALAQIKLAQDNKLEEIRQSCTTLISECKTAAKTSLADFDSRSLSTFAVTTDKTVNTMCADVQEACISVINNIGDQDWSEGITQITKNITEETIIETCTNIGHDCIINACSGSLGNFELCKDSYSDIRRSILSNTPSICYNEVEKCVKSSDLSDEDNSEILKKIWGECDDNNKISTSKSDILSWFASNTESDDCTTDGCLDGYKFDKTSQRCIKTNEVKTDDCRTANLLSEYINVTNSLTNYCKSGVKDRFNNCCTSAQTSNGICVPDQGWNALIIQEGSLCTDTTNTYYCPSKGRSFSLYCITTKNKIYFEPEDRNNVFTCSTLEKQNNSDTPDENKAFWLLVDNYGNYIYPKYDDSNKQPGFSPMQYRPGCTTTCNNNTCDENKMCTYTYSNSKWTFDGTSSGATCDAAQTPLPTNNKFLIELPNPDKSQRN